MNVSCDYYFPKPVWRSSLSKDVALEPIVRSDLPTREKD